MHAFGICYYVCALHVVFFFVFLSIGCVVQDLIYVVANVIVLITFNCVLLFAWSVHEFFMCCVCKVSNKCVQ